MVPPRRRALGYAAYLLVIAPNIAEADIGVPMIGVTLPGMLIALVPVIWIEAHYALRQLGLPRRRALGVSGAANAVSTLVGIPLTWLALAGLQMETGGGSKDYGQTLSGKLMAVTLQSPWLMPYGEKDLHWMVPTATLCLLVPFCFASVYIEYQIARRMLSEHPRAQVRAAVWRANLLSYGLLAALAILWLIYGLCTRGAA